MNVKGNFLVKAIVNISISDCSVNCSKQPVIVDRMNTKFYKNIATLYEGFDLLLNASAWLTFIRNKRLVKGKGIVEHILVISVE